MKVYYEVLPATLGRAMYRIQAGLKKYAPEWVEFTTTPESADVQIQDCIGAGSLPFIQNKNCILLQECLMTEIAPPDWLPHFQNAKLVVSYLNVPQIIGSDKFNFLRVPCGVDPDLFYPRNLAKGYKFLTTGYVAETESIYEVYTACQYLNKHVAHIGKDFAYGQHFHHFENISDDFLCQLYTNSFYVSGLRHAEGFELSILEGLLCGTRGVSYNAEHYSYWFGDLVEYINETTSEDVIEQLIDLINRPYRYVTNEERQYVIDTFSWKVVADKFWKGVKDAI